MGKRSKSKRNNSGKMANKKVGISKRSRQKTSTTNKLVARGSVPQVGKNVARNGGVINIQETDNVFEVDVEGPTTFNVNSVDDDATIKGSAEGCTVKFKQRSDAQKRSSDQQSTSSTERKMSNKKGEMSKRSRQETSTTNKVTRGSVPRVGKNVARNRGVIDIQETDNVFEVDVEGPTTFNVNSVDDDATIKGSAKGCKIKFKQRTGAQKRSSDQQSTSSSETTATDQHSSTKEAKKSPEETTEAQDNVTVFIKSLAKREKFSRTFRKSDKVKIMRDVIREKLGQDGVYQLFNSDQTKLKEDETFEQNGIQTNHTITIATEQYVECGAAPRGCKA